MDFEFVWKNTRYLNKFQNIINGGWDKYFHLEAVKKLYYEGYIDANYYRNKYCKHLTDEQVLHAYLDCSWFDARNYSEKVDSIGYLMTFQDIRKGGVSPTSHYCLDGKQENRTVTRRFKDFSLITNAYAKNQFDIETTRNKINRVAMHLHVYYLDYCDRFFKMLLGFPFKFDLLISSPYSEAEINPCEFSRIANVENVVFKQCSNRGRNFGSCLVDFRQLILEYDLVCHLHSKKSLYSGQEQLGWSFYNIHFLAGDTVSSVRHFEIFENNPQVGLLGLVPYYNIPFWGNHWLKNHDSGRSLVERLKVDFPTEGLHCYPVGGMCWFRPQAIRQLLEYPWDYSDFNEENGQTDGELQHAIERSLSSICSGNGFSPIYYEPWSNNYSVDLYDMLGTYRTETKNNAISVAKSFQVVSFDVFDTIVFRTSHDVDLGKRGVELYLVQNKIIDEKYDFVKLRNEVELKLRAESSFRSDVSLENIYATIVDLLNIRQFSPRVLADLEFDCDFVDIVSRPAVVSIVNEIFINSRCRVIFTTDTYYSKSQIEKIIHKSGVVGYDRLYVSSAFCARKDNFSIWRSVLNNENISKDDLVHFGDDFVVDNQLLNEQGFHAYILLSVYEKARQFVDVFKYNPILDKSYLQTMVNSLGKSPFFLNE